MENVLEKIIKQKKEDINKIKKNISSSEIQNNIKIFNNFLDFKNTIIQREKNNKISLIAEIKKASPSAGIIVENFDHKKIASGPLLPAPCAPQGRRPARAAAAASPPHQHHRPRARPGRGQARRPAGC